MEFLVEHPLVAPALLVIAVGSIALAPLLARVLRCRPVVAAAVLLSAAAPLALTLLPSDGGRSRFRWCAELVREPSDWGAHDVANLLMLLPLGVLAVTALRRRRTVLALGYGLLLPPFAEAVQFALRRIGRECDLTDLVLNLTGLAIGVLLGLLGRRLSRRRTAPGPRPTAWPRT